MLLSPMPVSYKTSSLIDMFWERAKEIDSKFFITSFMSQNFILVIASFEPNASMSRAKEVTLNLQCLNLSSFKESFSEMAFARILAFKSVKFTRVT